MSAYRRSNIKEKEESISSVSTHEQRINKIFERLTDIRSGVELEKDRRMEELTDRLEDLFDRMKDFGETAEMGLTALKEDITTLEELVDRSHTVNGRERNQESKKLQDRCSYEIESEMINRKESETAISRLLDDKCNNIALQIIQQSKKREAAINDLKESLACDLPRLSAELQEQEGNREESDAELMEEIAEGLTLCTTEIDNIKHQRQTSEETIYEMLRDVLVRVGEQLQLEQKTRETTEESILGLIEGMCDKVSSSDG